MRGERRALSESIQIPLGHTEIQFDPRRRTHSLRAFAFFFFPPPSHPPRRVSSKRAYNAGRPPLHAIHHISQPSSALRRGGRTVLLTRPDEDAPAVTLPPVLMARREYLLRLLHSGKKAPFICSKFCLEFRVSLVLFHAVSCSCSCSRQAINNAVMAFNGITPGRSVRAP